MRSTIPETICSYLTQAHRFCAHCKTRISLQLTAWFKYLWLSPGLFFLTLNDMRMKYFYDKSSDMNRKGEMNVRRAAKSEIREAREPWKNAKIPDAVHHSHYFTCITEIRNRDCCDYRPGVVKLLESPSHFSKFEIFREPQLNTYLKGMQKKY